MPAPPARTAISDTYPNPSNATARTGFGALWDYTTGLLGATGNQAEALVAIGATGRLINVRVITATGTYTPTTGTTSIIAMALGGGGGGGGSSATGPGAIGCGGGGTSGSLAVSRFTSGFSGLTVTIGAAGGPGSIGNVGGNGGTTSLGGILTAPGGIGGQTSGSLAVAFAGVNGTPSLPTGVNFFSQGAQLGTPGWGSFAGGVVMGGGGGSSQFGVGGYRSSTSTGNVAGNGASGYGCGGGGCASGPSQGGAAGAAGTIGVMFIYEFS